ncbi:MAG TPA: hypothetical protein VGQ03_08960 [Nitrososphaera sp.]|jgi:hypothetical protein|nr:hypothetical protein [Nitrososphaera sp.]
MISVTAAIIIAVAAFAAGSFFASPVPQAIAAVIATDVQCTGCVGTSDLGGNAVNAAKIKDGEVKAAEIATDAVGAAELVGVTKLLFGQCMPTSTVATSDVATGGAIIVICTISGVDNDDSAIATLNLSSLCFNVARADTGSGNVSVYLRNDCASTQSIGAGTIAVIVYDK